MMPVIIHRPLLILFQNAYGQKGENLLASSRKVSKSQALFLLMMHVIEDARGGHFVAFPFCYYNNNNEDYLYSAKEPNKRHSWRFTYQLFLHTNTHTLSLSISPPLPLVLSSLLSPDERVVL